MITVLLDLAVRGTVASLVVLGLDWALAKHMRPAGRRTWWILVAVAWLVPVRLPHFGALPQWLAPDFAQVLHPSTPVSPGDAVAATPTAASASLQPAWSRVIGAVLLAGALATFLVIAARTVRTARRWNQERLSTDADLLGLLEDCKASAGITAPIGLVLTSSVSTPALLGWLRPRILVPQALLATLSREQLRSILLHELAHFRSIDIPLNWLFSAALAVHWFNPVAHLAARRWRHFRELAADAAVLGWMPAGTNDVYGGALLSALRHAHHLPVPRGALALAESVTPMKERIALVAGGGPRARHAWLGTLVALGLAGFVAVPSRAVPPPVDDHAAEKAAAQRAAEAWVAIIDADRYAESWQVAHPESQKAISVESWEKSCAMMREQFGYRTGRTLQSATYQTMLRGADGQEYRGEFVFLQYDSTYAKVSAARDSVLMVRQPDGQWRAGALYIVLR